MDSFDVLTALDVAVAVGVQVDVAVAVQVDVAAVQCCLMSHMRVFLADHCLILLHIVDVAAPHGVSIQDLADEHGRLHSLFH